MVNVFDDITFAPEIFPPLPLNTFTSAVPITNEFEDPATLKVISLFEITLTLLFPPANVPIILPVTVTLPLVLLKVNALLPPKTPASLNCTSVFTPPGVPFPPPPLTVDQ